MIVLKLSGIQYILYSVKYKYSNIQDILGRGKNRFKNIF